jgi:hypothetical protein
MQPASSLFFNDAPWLAADCLPMLHPSIATATAELLGAQSLRYHHQVSKPPMPGKIRQCLRVQYPTIPLSCSLPCKGHDMCSRPYKEHDMCRVRSCYSCANKFVYASAGGRGGGF